jgi:hypothetical protein
MAGRPGVASGAKAVDKDEKIKGLVDNLIYDSVFPFSCPRPEDAFGYLNTDLKSGGPDFSMRKQVVEAQQLLLDDAGNPVDYKAPDAKAKAEALDKTYEDLHQAQGKYINGLLHGEKPDLAAFKIDQEKKIKACEEKLDDLKKAIEAKKTSEMKVMPPVPDSIKELDKALASINEQKKLLHALPGTIEADRDHLIQKLEIQKRRNQENKADQEINNKGAFDRSKIFSVYFKRDNKKELKLEADMKSGAAAPEIMSASAGGGAKANKPEMPGYGDAVRTVRAEIARMEAANPPDDQGWFCPFGEEDNNIKYLIHRYKDKNGQWYLEPEMLRDNKINTTADFREMMKSIFEFQKFSGCVTDSITLSYDKPVFGEAYVNQRVDQILDLVRQLIEEGNKELNKNPDDPSRDLSKVKALHLDENSRKALFAHQPGIFEKMKGGKSKREEIVDGLKQLENMAVERDRKINLTAQKETKLNKEVKKQVDDIANVIDDKVFLKSDLYAKREVVARAAGAGAVVAPPLSYSLEALKGVLDDKIAAAAAATPLTLDEKKQVITDAYEAEKKEIEALSHSLVKVQDELTKTLDNINKNDLDPGHKNYEAIGKNLKDLEGQERKLHEMLEVRCEQWLMKGDDGYISKFPPGDLKDCITQDKHDKFQNDIRGLKNGLDARKDTVDKLKDDVTKIVSAIEKNVVDEKANKEAGYANLSKRSP